MEGDAEPIDGRVGISGMVIVRARYAILAVLLFVLCRGFGESRVGGSVGRKTAGGSTARFLNLVPWRSVCSGM